MSRELQNRLLEKIDKNPYQNLNKLYANNFRDGRVRAHNNPDDEPGEDGFYSYCYKVSFDRD